MIYRHDGTYWIDEDGISHGTVELRQYCFDPYTCKDELRTFHLFHTNYGIGSEIHTDKANFSHREDGPAVIFDYEYIVHTYKGYQEYTWHGNVILSQRIPK